MINRRELVSMHDPILKEADVTTPLSVGNGNFAFTADVTGLQSLYQEYLDADNALCTMSTWGWHTTPVSTERYEYTLDDLKMTEFEGAGGRKLVYPKNPAPGNEEVYHWLRQNPHRLNLARIGFVYENRELCEAQLEEINQRLHLYEGVLESHFVLCGEEVNVRTLVDSESDTLAVEISSALMAKGDLSVEIRFPYGSPMQSGADFTVPQKHDTQRVQEMGDCIVWKRTLDKDVYYMTLNHDGILSGEEGAHRLQLKAKGERLVFTCRFCAQPKKAGNDASAEQIWEKAAANCKQFYRKFWEEGGILQLHNSEDSRALELERREILSLYLLTINSMGQTPPQETGLTCNSWYGKMHLEMYFWHCAWAPLWGRGYLLDRSLPWYLEHLPQARENAARNGYRGARWPKMVGVEGIDAPSGIAPLLVWQQPHIIFMLELRRRELGENAREFMRKYWQVVQETAEFMADMADWNEEKGVYELLAPMIPVQECHRCEDVRNPAFEVVYWRYGLSLAMDWAVQLGEEVDDKWRIVRDRMIAPLVQDGLYPAHENCPKTFTEFNHDHPSMLMALGVIPGEEIDREAMRATLHRVLECWRYPDLWGWDFAVMAMCAASLGEPETAVDILLKETLKNEYVISGNNRQSSRRDLPLYLPGNGSLLLALALMGAGGDGNAAEHPGFGAGWTVEAEGLLKYV